MADNPAMHPRTLDPRLRVAVDASLAWYEALCALHGVRCGIEDDTWVAYDPPPPLHSVAKTIEPSAGPDRVCAPPWWSCPTSGPTRATSPGPIC
jgi:hypothetical protein